MYNLKDLLVNFAVIVLYYLVVYMELATRASSASVNLDGQASFVPKVLDHRPTP